MSKSTARSDDQTTDAGTPEDTAVGEPMAPINGKPAARVGDVTAQGGCHRHWRAHSTDRRHARCQDGWCHGAGGRHHLRRTDDADRRQTRRQAGWCYGSGGHHHHQRRNRSHRLGGRGSRTYCPKNPLPKSPPSKRHASISTAKTGLMRLIVLLIL